MATTEETVARHETTISVLKCDLGWLKKLTWVGIPSAFTFIFILLTVCFGVTVSNLNKEVNAALDSRAVVEAEKRAKDAANAAETSRDNVLKIEADIKDKGMENLGKLNQKIVVNGDGTVAVKVGEGRFQFDGGRAFVYYNASGQGQAVWTDPKGARPEGH